MKPLRYFLSLGVIAAGLCFGAEPEPTPVNDTDNVPAVEAQPESPPTPAPTKTHKTKRAQNQDHDRVKIGGTAMVAAGEWADDVVAVFGHVQVDGTARGDAVAILGSLTMNGKAEGDVVSVLGKLTINGPVKEAVCVLGDVELGPLARVDQLVVVGGNVTRDPAAVVGKEEVVLGLSQASWKGIEGAGVWLREALLRGRLLSFHPATSWAWGVAAVCLAMYVFIALILGRSLNACAERLEQRPGHVILTAFITAILSPLLLVLLSITFIGPFVYLMLLMTAWVIGKAAFLNWLGRRVLLPLGLTNAALATLLGGVLLMLIYLVPVLSLILWKLSGFIGVGIVVSATLHSIKRDQAPATPSQGLPMKMAAPDVSPTADTESRTLPEPQANAFQEDMLQFPRAGSAPRFNALLIDALLVGFISVVVPLVAFVPLFLVYSLVGWAMRGTTVGGAICRLQVVRLDRRQMNWTIAAVRTLGGVLSVLPVGYGLLRVDGDREKQTWHDQIAGTTVVVLPKARPLI